MDIIKLYKCTNEEKVLVAVKQDGMVLAYVPHEYRTAEICFEAVKNNDIYAYRDGRNPARNHGIR